MLQVRKDGEKFMAHPARVAARVARRYPHGLPRPFDFGSGPSPLTERASMIRVALCHDVVEDCAPKWHSAEALNLTETEYRQVRVVALGERRGSRRRRPAFHV